LIQYDIGGRFGKFQGILKYYIALFWGGQMSFEKIKKLLSGRKDELKKTFNIKEIGLFGSYVRREQKRGSDLDVLVEFKKVPGLFKFLRLEDYLTKALGIKVDLVRKKAIRKELRQQILNEVVYL
jgi:predicted nucleotidyltransferase